MIAEQCEMAGQTPGWRIRRMRGPGKSDVAHECVRNLIGKNDGAVAVMPLWLAR
jgi:hypothetical protein